MKKFLSLVLALVMTMSLVTISAGAKDFTDGDKINYEEAIDVMSAVKVIDGYTDGSFKPATQLNRGQAAKIICNMVLGPTTASALKADAAPFKDVAADNTFAGYIAYCVQAGLIDGYTDGTYKPTAPLTGYAFMKYLLGVLGYDKDVEGYNGTNWSINVAKQALAVGLDSGLAEEFDGTKIVTREEACLFAFNAMKAPVVEYSDKTEVSAGGVTVTTSGTRYEQDNNAIYPDKLGDANSLQFSEKYFKNLRCSDGRDDFGRPVTTWTLKTEKVGTYVNYTQKVGEYTKKVAVSDLYELVGSTTAKHVASVNADLHVYMNGVDTTENDAAPQNGASKKVLEQVSLDSNPFALTAAKRNSTKVGGTGVVTEVYVDDSAANPEVTIVSYATYLYQASEDYNAKKETVRIGAAGDTDWCLGNSKSLETLYADDFDIADIKADDYLLVTMAWVNGDWTIKSVTPAETVTGVVNTYSQDGSNVTVGGTKYDYAFSTSSASSDTQKTTFTVGQEAKVVLDAYGNVIGVADAVVNSNYVFIRKTATTSALSTTALADAYFTDGTKDEIVVKQILDDKDDTLTTNIRGNAYRYTGWYTFSKNSAGKYTLTEAEKKYDYQGMNGDGNRANDNVTVPVGTNTAIVTGNQVTNNLGSVYADNATVFVVRESDGTVTTYTGVKNVPDIKTGARNGASVTYLRKVNGLLGFVFIELANDAVIEGSAKSDLLYVLSYDGKTWIDDMNTYHTYKVLDENGEKTTIKTDDKIFNGNATFGTGNVDKVYGLYRNTRTNSDGYVTSAPVVGALSGTALTNDAGGSEYVSGIISGASPITYSNETIWIDRSGSTTARYVLADDAKIVLVSRDADLNRDPGASYEASVLTGKALASAVNGYTITGYYQGVLKSSTSNVLTTLYVTVTTAR